MQSTPPEEVLEEAANWVARLNADDRTPDDEARFRAWLDASPEHATAFEVMDRGWTLLGSMPPPTQQPDKRVSRRGLVMAGLAGGFAVAGSFFVLRPATAKTFETAVGEQRHVALEDGSKLFLNANTRLTVSLGGAARTADIAYGRVNFDIAPDATHPFVVNAGARQIVSHGSNFDVGLAGSGVQIILIRGSADVIDRVGATAPARTLHNGDRLWSNGASVKLDRPRIAPLIAWKTRTAIFDDNLLSDAVNEMNLYSPAQLEIGDSRAARLHISGIYRVGDNAAFAHSIAKFLPVQVSRQGEHLILRSNVSG